MEWWLRALEYDFCFSFQNQVEKAMSIFSQIMNPESITCTNLNVSDFLVVSSELKCAKMPAVFVCVR